MKLLKGIVEVIATLAVLTVFGFYVGKLLFPFIGGFAALLGAIVIFACGYSILYFAFIGKRREWLQEYWERNVRGNNGWWYQSLDGKTDAQGVCLRGTQPNWTNFQPSVVIIVPFGGWFRTRLGQAFTVDSGLNPNPFTDWRVRRIVSIRFCPPIGVGVEVADWRGCKIQFAIPQVIRFFDWVHNGKAIADWQWQIAELMDRINVRGQQLDGVRVLWDITQKAHLRAEANASELRGQVKNMERDRIYLLERAIHLVRETKRFIKSEQAETIVIKLIELLLKRLPENDERVAFYTRLRNQLRFNQPRNPKKKSAKIPVK